MSAAAIGAVGLGIDAVEVGRFGRVLDRRPRLAERLFTEEERSHAGRFSDPVPRLAARFAAKEAVMKALGVGIGAFAFRDVEVTRLPGGAPALELGGAAARLAADRLVRSWEVSITHTAAMAEAVVIALVGA